MDADKLQSPPVSLKKALAGGKAYIDILLEEDFPVLCVNRSAKKQRRMPFKALYDNNRSFWTQAGVWEFFIASGDFEKLEELAVLREKPWTAPAVQAEAAVTEPAPAEADRAVDGFGDEYEAVAAMSGKQRVALIQEDKRRLDVLAAQKTRPREEVTGALVNAVRDAALANQTTLMDAMKLADGEAKEYTQSLVDSTRAMVRSSTQLVTADIFNDELMNTLVAKSNGTIIQHMTRVFLNGIAFLSYYNNLVSSSSAINRLRISFGRKYHAFYRGLLPHVDPEVLSLERVFFGGMRAVNETDFHAWAAGFLVHDVGKASAVEYHEGESAYDRGIVVEHVRLGYSSVMTKTNYPREAGLITGYHHEYYGDPGGYGYFRGYLNRYKKANPAARQDYCISYELEPMIDFQALAYFPAKILEIIDVYDSVTDPNRKYRKPMTCEEALAMMREEFIEKHRKLDLILFDFFDAFARKK